MAGGLLAGFLTDWLIIYLDQTASPSVTWLSSFQRTVDSFFVFAFSNVFLFSASNYSKLLFFNSFYFLSSLAHFLHSYVRLIVRSPTSQLTSRSLPYDTSSSLPPSLPS